MIKPREITLYPNNEKTIYVLKSVLEAAESRLALHLHLTRIQIEDLKTQLKEAQEIQKFTDEVMVKDLRLKLQIAIDAFRSQLDHICDGGGNFPCSQMWYQDVAEETLKKLGVK